MPNDPKDQTVDWSKVTQPDNAINTQSMITSLNEGATLTGVETAAKNDLLVGHETFTDHSKEKK